MSTRFGDTLRAIRSELAMPQIALAHALGTTQRHVSFLETGRSQPSAAMVGRMATELALNAGQRAALFEASGLTNPYKRRDFSSSEVAEALDLLDRQLLAVWPYPGFVLDADWTILRRNAPAARMVAALAGGAEGEAPDNMFSLFLSDGFQSRISNWQDASAAFYFRMMEAALRRPALQPAFDEARARGLFSSLGGRLLEGDEIPIFVPIEMTLPGGATLRASSLLGRLASIHDALVEGFEVELMVPMDDASAALMRQMLGG